MHDSIKAVLASPSSRDRRVIMVAFVGGQAQAFLPDPAGLEIVCWLQPGSTDALALERLLKRGAKIFKSERLHMKVYWSSRRGCVMCSANASGQALGGGIQKEAGVWLPPGTVNINRLLIEAKPVPITPSDLKRLTRLSGRVYNYNTSNVVEHPPTFAEWYNFVGRSTWKIVGCNATGRLSTEAIDTAKQTYGGKPYQFVCTSKKLTINDWVLLFGIHKIADLEWIHIDFVVKIPRADRTYHKDLPFQAVQAELPRLYRPPFKLDRKFIAAFKRSIKAYGIQRLANIDVFEPPKKLLDIIAAEIRQPG
jgi:hypothetical protein